MLKDKCKNVIKTLYGYINCKINRVKYENGVYIGRKVDIKNGYIVHLNHDVSIRPYCQIWSGGDGIEIGARTEIGERCRISIINKLSIGMDVLISPNAYISDCDHEYRNINIPVINQATVNKVDNEIKIEDGSYIGINTVIIGKVNIGKHCVIGANSVVTRDIPDYCVAAGAPVKIIKRYDKNKGEWIKCI